MSQKAKEIANEIWESESRIFILYGSNDSEKRAIVKAYDTDFAGIVELPISLVRKRRIFESEEEEESEDDTENYLNTITAMMLYHKNYVIYENDLTQFCPIYTKGVINGDLFLQAETFIGIERSCPIHRNLIIVTNDDPHNSIFDDDYHCCLRMICKFIQVDKE